MLASPLLDEPARRILALLASLVINVKPDDPRTFIGYKIVHERLGLSMLADSWGNSLKIQGLQTLAEWCFENSLPAITGLVIDTRPDKLMPSKGYYTAFGRKNDDIGWWINEIRRARTFDWTTYLTKDRELALLPPPYSPKAADMDEPAPRCEAKTYRVLRDTLLAREVKRWHNYKCQVCGDSIELPSGDQYAEAHHIRPLGTPHDGPDRAENIICLCPNHHVEFDYGVRPLRLADLRRVAQHQLSEEYVSYHNQHIWKIKAE